MSHSQPDPFALHNNPAMGSPVQSIPENFFAEQVRPGSPGYVPPDVPGATTPTQQQHQRIQPTSKFWTIEFFQQFFDVDTNQVLLRLNNTLLPFIPPDFLIGLGWHYKDGGEAAPNTTALPPTAGPGVPPHQAERGTIGDSMFYTENGALLSRSPDLYGPFWVCTTLWMMVGVVGNLLDRISTYRMNARALAKDPNAEVKDWNYDFSVVSVACATIYAYCVIMSLILWGLMRWKDLPVGLTHVLCLYGYSMFVFLLSAVLCAAPIKGLHIIFCATAFVWSAGYLILNLWWVWKRSLNRAWFLGILIFVLVAHAGLTLAFKFYFFGYAL